MFHYRGAVLLCISLIFAGSFGKANKIWGNGNSQRESYDHDRFKKDVSSYPFGLSEVKSQNASFDKNYTKEVGDNIIHSFTYTEQTNLVRFIASLVLFLIYF